MWIVRIALERPYTFIVLALLILIVSPVVIARTPTDIFPNVNIPVIAVAWQYRGLNAEELEGRITTSYERVLTTTVDNIQRIESTTVNGQAIIKVYLQPNASLDTANAQITAISQTVIRQYPPGTTPPLIINFSASSVPILQLALSGEGLAEQQLFDLGVNFLRPQLVTIRGVAIPFPFGGKQRQVMVDLNTRMLQAKGLAPADVLNTINLQNLVLPSRTAKIGGFEYYVNLNAAPRTVPELADLPVKVVGNSTIYLRDVANVRDGFGPQTNIVRHDGRRGTLLTVLKAGDASTLDVVDNIRAAIPRVATTLPPELKVDLLADQSVFVRGAITGVINEAIIAACLTALMILLFLGSWRSTLIIAVSIALSILTSVIVLSFLGETINIMTLGGLALAVGILVDDATVTIENIERFLEEGRPLREAILEGAAQIAVPALVSTLCICIVFLPMFFLGGVARYLFVPLAEAVVFAMLASYLLSRTLVPTLAIYLLKAKDPSASRNLFTRFQRGFERGFERVRSDYQLLLTSLVLYRRAFVPVFLLLCLSAFVLVPWLGQDFFPSTDGGNFILHVRGKTGLRIEETARLCDLVEQSIRQTIPAGDLDNILDNIGLPYSGLNTMHLTSGIIGAGDADVMVTLKPHHQPTANYVRALRASLPRDFSSAIFYFLPADITTQILNFGLPAPIDVQFRGNDIETSAKLAADLKNQLLQVPGLVDLRVQQPMDYPTYNVDIDRTKAQQGGYAARDVGQSMLNTLSGSFQISPMYFLNWKNGVNYQLVAQTPQYRMQSIQDLQNIPVNVSGAKNPEILADVASIHRGGEMAVISEYNMRRVVDIYGAVQGRDLGGVSHDVTRIVNAYKKKLPRATSIEILGQADTMRSSYVSLIGGLLFSIVLVYMLIVVNFQSWLGPFIIITALPAALAGIVLFLFYTHTTLSVPALMGAIMCMGVATANSILMISFAKIRYTEHQDAVLAAIGAGQARFRPVCMNDVAMIIGMIPIALGLRDGCAPNAAL